MFDAMHIKKDDQVCVVGFGTARLLHEHHVVTKIGKSFINSVSTSSSHARQPVPRRHRRDNAASIPRGDGKGGSTIHSACQRPKL